MNAYETKLSNPDEWQIAIDRSGRKIKFGNTITINTFGDLIYYFFIEKLATFTPRNNYQCDNGRARSIDDAYKAAKYYNFDCSLKQVKDAVELLYKKRLEFGLTTNSGWAILYHSFCNVVRKRVHGRNIGTTVEEINAILSKHNMNYEKV